MRIACLISTLLILCPFAIPELAMATPEEEEVNGITFVWCPPGTFDMGNRQSCAELANSYGGLPEWYADSSRSKTVKLTNGFWLSKFEITIKQWNNYATESDRKVAQTNEAEDEQRPVSNISIPQIRGFLKSINGAGPQVFRLPDEIEWEYACRAGSLGEFYGGDGVGVLDSIAWYSGNTRPEGIELPKPVGQKKPNDFGLYDMLGNVSEWCSSNYDEPFSFQSNSVYADGGSTEVLYVVRGGSIRSTPSFVRCATRLTFEESFKSPFLGFRLIWNKGNPQEKER